MKVLHVIQRFHPAIGGAEHWAAGLVRRQTARGHEVRVATLNVLEERDYWSPAPKGDRQHALGRNDVFEGARVRRYERLILNPFGWRARNGDGNSSGSAIGVLGRLAEQWLLGPHSLSLYADLPRLARWADVVHLHTAPYPHNIAGLLAARATGRPAVITPHFHPDARGFDHPLTRLTLRFADVTFAVTRYEYEALLTRGVPAGRIVITGNAVDTDAHASPDKADVAAVRKRLGLRPKEKVLLYLGRKLEQKGLGVLFDAVPRMEATARIVLAGPDSPWFQRRLRSLPASLRRRIVDVGEVSESGKRALLRCASALVQPSPNEAFGIVFLEAWAAGIPVIGARTGAVAEVVEGGGLLFERGDADGLTAATNRLLGDAKLRRSLAAAGRKKLAENYCWEKIADKIERTYERLLPPGSDRSDG